MVVFVEREAPIRVIVDDHDLVQAGVRDMLEPFGARVRVLDGSCAADDLPADVLLFDPYPDRVSAVHRARSLSRSGDVTRSVLYTWDHVDGHETWAAWGTAHAVLSKSLPADALVAKLELLVRDRTNRHVEHLSATVLGDRELQILTLLCAGMSNRDIADALYLSVNTVKTHTRNLYVRLGVSNRTQAAMVALGRARIDSALGAPEPGRNGDGDRRQPDQRTPHVTLRGHNARPVPSA